MLLDRVVKLAGGNPFAAIELARSAAAADERAGPMGALVLRGLGADATAALTKVAVLGADFDTDEYVALSGVGEAQAYALLDEALAAGAVERTGAGYRFRHSLVRDALLDGLPPHRLLPLHRRGRRRAARPRRVPGRGSATSCCRPATSAPPRRSCCRPPAPTRPSGHTATRSR